MDPLSRVTEHTFLTSREVEAVLTGLSLHRDRALDRSPASPGTFVTFGRAAYLDVCLQRADAERDYYEKLVESNRALQEILGDLYERLREKMEQILGEPVVYLPDELALPGVHVFRGPGIRSAADAGAHFDVQYQRLRFPSELDAETAPISITLPLRNPTHGTGLLVHDVTHDDYVRAYRMGRISTLEDLVRRRTSAYYPYTPGQLFLHYGLVVHCLASPGPILPEDERISLQAHGIRCRGTWILYW